VDVVGRTALGRPRPASAPGRGNPRAGHSAWRRGLRLRTDRELRDRPSRCSPSGRAVRASCPRPATVNQAREPDSDAPASCLAAARPDPLRFAILLRSRTGHYFPVVALAAVLLAHSPAVSRFDEILYLVEQASDLTLPAFGRCPVHGTSGAGVDPGEKGQDLS
jgi:hypothetical protein